MKASWLLLALGLSAVCTLILWNWEVWYWQYFAYGTLAIALLDAVALYSVFSAKPSSRRVMQYQFPQSEKPPLPPVFQQIEQIRRQFQLPQSQQQPTLPTQFNPLNAVAQKPVIVEEKREVVEEKVKPKSLEEVLEIALLEALRRGNADFTFELSYKGEVELLGKKWEAKTNLKLKPRSVRKQRESGVVY